MSTRASTGAVINALDANRDATLCNISVQHFRFYTCASGTSMAAPHVAGVIALMEEASGGTLTPDQAYGALTQTATRMSGYGLHEVGAGYLNAYQAVSAVKR